MNVSKIAAEINSVCSIHAQDLSLCNMYQIPSADSNQRHKDRSLTHTDNILVIAKVWAVCWQGSYLYKMIWM